LVPGHGPGDHLCVSAANPEDIEDESLHAVPGHPEKNELAIVQLETSIDEEEDSEKDDGTDQVVKGDGVIDSAEPVGAHRCLGTLETVVLGSHVVAGLDPVSPRNISRPAEMLDNDQITDPPHDGPQSSNIGSTS